MLVPPKKIAPAKNIEGRRPFVGVHGRPPADARQELPRPQVGGVGPPQQPDALVLVEGLEHQARGEMVKAPVLEVRALRGGSRALGAPWPDTTVSASSTSGASRANVAR